MKPYSIDLGKGKNFNKKLAERFGVAKSFVQKLIKKYQETGDVRPLRGSIRVNSSNSH